MSAPPLSELTRLSISAILASGEKGATLRQCLSDVFGDDAARLVLDELRSVGIDPEGVGTMRASEVRARQERLRRAYHEGGALRLPWPREHCG